MVACPWWVFCPGTACSARRWFPLVPMPALPGPQLSVGPPAWQRGPGSRSQISACPFAERGCRARRWLALDGITAPRRWRAKLGRESVGRPDPGRLPWSSTSVPACVGSQESSGSCAWFARRWGRTVPAAGQRGKCWRPAGRSSLWAAGLGAGGSERAGLCSPSRLRPLQKTRW